MQAKKLLTGAITILVVMVLAASSGFAADISGTTEIAGKTATEVVITLDGPGLANTHARPMDGYVMDHRDLDFTPHVIVIPAGATVRFENSDNMPCRIYSTSPARQFVIRPAEGKAIEISFDETGVVRVRCMEHGRIVAYVIVRDNPFYAITDNKGRYRLSNVPPGHYLLQAWHEGIVIASRTVEVGKDKLKINFNTELQQPSTRNQNEEEAILSGKLAGMQDILVNHSEEK